MMSANLSLWMILTVMVLVVTLSTCEGYNLNAPEELDTMERQLRAPFNGMRGKRGPFNLNMYKKVTKFSWKISKISNNVLKHLIFEPLCKMVFHRPIELMIPYVKEVISTG